MMRSAAFLFVLAMAAPARADDTVDTLGRFPTLEAGFVGGFGSTPVAYTFDHGFGPHDASEGVFGGFVGPDVDLHVETPGALVTAQGMYNLLASEVGWVARGQIVLGKGLGFRSSHNVIKSISDSPADASGHFTRTTEYYVHKRVPAYIGLSAGLSVWGLNAVTYDDAVDGATMRAPATLAVIDAGFTIKSPQLELTLAPMYDVTTGTTGFRWVFGMAFPIGNHPLYFRTSGDHFIGDAQPGDRGNRLGMLFLFSLGFGSSMHLGL